MGRYLVLLAIVLTLGMALVPSAQARIPRRQQQQAMAEPQIPLQKYPGRYYNVFTDLSEEQLDGILPRLDRLAEEYAHRTAAFSRVRDDRRLPFYLFKHRSDYEKAGGPSDSAGIFDGDRLLAFIGEKADARAWHVIQHEAFHQYLTARVGYDIPIWLNEGMAEYFGEGLYTGDGFVFGIVPPWRLDRTRREIDSGELLSLRQLITISHEQWNAAMKLQYYDQAWLLVQYLWDGDEGQHQQGLVRYLKQTSNGIDPIRSFSDCIGDIDVCEKDWQQYVRAYSHDEGSHLYAQAAAQTVCSFLARSTLTRQRISSLNQLGDLAKESQLLQPRGDALSPQLLLECLDWAKEMGQWEIDLSGRRKANVTLTLKDGTVALARFITEGTKITAVRGWLERAGDQPRSNGHHGR